MPLCHIAKQVFREAVKTVLNDEAFKLPSTEARVALETAIKVTEWMDDATPQKEARGTTPLEISYTCPEIKGNQGRNHWKSGNHFTFRNHFSR